MADRKISDLTALTAPASGDYLPIVDISEAAAANKNKRITIEELFRGIPLGTAAAPSIAIEGDENTGIYSPGADQLAISTGGSGRLFVDASGQVGIGTSSPGSLLHLAQSAADAVVRIDGGSSNTSFIDFRIAGSNKSYVGLGGLTGGSNNDLINYNSSAGNWIAYTNGSERLRITSAGNVGIGTTSPTAPVEISATSAGLRVTSSNTGTSYINLGDTDSANIGGLEYYHTTNSLAFIVNATERLRIDSSGRLLVGTSSNSGGALLQVNGDRIRVATAKTPASATDTGTAGEICWDANYIYVCTATNTWKRTAISTW